MKAYNMKVNVFIILSHTDSAILLKYGLSAALDIIYIAFVHNKTCKNMPENCL